MGKKTISQKFVREFFRVLGQVLPKNRTGDRIWTWCKFVSTHGRVPRRGSERYIDYLYDFKISDALYRPIRGYTSDKEDVKHYVHERMGDQYCIPTIQLLRSIEDVDNYEFPERCVIKPTHGSGEVILRKSGEPIPLKTIKSWFKKNKYFSTREVQYRYLEPKVIVEDFVFDSENLVDYKFVCFKGRVRFIDVIYDRANATKSKLYGRDWEDLKTAIDDHVSETPVPRPTNLEAMVAFAEALSEDFGFVRIDLYSDGRQFLLGEITHYPANNAKPITPKENEDLLDDLFFGRIEARAFTVSYQSDD